MITSSPPRPAFRAVGDIPARNTIDPVVVLLSGLLVLVFVFGIWFGLLDDTELRSPLAPVPSAVFQHPEPVVVAP